MAIAAAAAFACSAAPALAQDEAAQPKAGWSHLFFDDADGDFDFSDFLGKGGFIPVPIIITEPAVGGGGGVAAAFLSLPKARGRAPGINVAAGVKTGNGSHFAGYFQSGDMMGGEVSYRFGIGKGEITLEAHPRGLPSGLEYTTEFDYGIIGGVRVHMPDRRFSIGPSIDFRKLNSHLDFDDIDPELRPDFNQSLRTGAVGLGVYYDSRDNSLTPTRGLNAYVEGKLNSAAFGSDRNYEVYSANLYDFWRLSDRWRVAAKVETSAIRGDYPSYFAPYVGIRGVEASRFLGENVLSSEAETTWKVSDRWSLVAFAGYGESQAGSRRIYTDSGAIWAGGVGFRYRIARKFGLDAGLDIAAGPEGEIWYLQVGHAWSTGMN